MFVCLFVSFVVVYGQRFQQPHVFNFSIFIFSYFSRFLVSRAFPGLLARYDIHVRGDDAMMMMVFTLRSVRLEYCSYYFMLVIVAVAGRDW